MSSILDCPRHICAFFNNRDEEYRCLVDFVRDGIEAGDRFFHVVDANCRPRHRQRLIEGGIDVRSLEDRGRLEILGWDSSFLVDGAFNQKKMLAMMTRSSLTMAKARPGRCCSRRCASRMGSTPASFSVASSSCFAEVRQRGKTAKQARKATSANDVRPLGQLR